MTIPRILEELHRLAHRQWAKSTAELGVSHSQFEYLRAIEVEQTERTDEFDHGQHLHDVVTTVGVKKASASAMVVKLEQRGLVERVPCQFDARAQHILISKSGADRLREGETVYERAADELRASVGDEAYASLATLFASLQSLLD